MKCKVIETNHLDWHGQRSIGKVIQNKINQWLESVGTINIKYITQSGSENFYFTTIFYE